MIHLFFPHVSLISFTATKVENLKFQLVRKRKEKTYIHLPIPLANAKTALSSCDVGLTTPL